MYKANIKPVNLSIVVTNWIIYGLGALLLLYLGICAFYYFFQDRLIFVPAWPVSRSNDLLLASEFESYFLDTPYDGEIHAIHIKTRDPKGIILYFHGNTGSMVRWGPIAEELTTFGFDVFLPDYRGYGLSHGKRSEEILYSDAMACYQKVLELYPENKICIYGRSLGTGMASWLAARTSPAAIILETPFYNFVEAASAHSRLIPVKLFLRYSFRNDIHLPKAKAPILIAHGTKDKLVPYRSGLKLFKAVDQNGQNQMLTIPGGKHGNLNGYPVFREGLASFLETHFPSRA